MAPIDADHGRAHPQRQSLLPLLELRAPCECAATLALLPWWGLAPAGDGHPVMVLPGLGVGDESTGLLRRFLRGRGYAVHPWALGANTGLHGATLLRAHDRVADLAARHGRRVSLVGWSLGGVYARALARRAPRLVRSVITLGSPIAAPPAEMQRAGLYGEPVGAPREGFASAGAQVPTTSIWSRSDAIVPWPCSVAPPRPLAENIEVDASHFGLGMNPAVLYAMADRLAQPEGAWRPFSRAGLRGLFYGGDASDH